MLMNARINVTNYAWRSIKCQMVRLVSSFKSSEFKKLLNLLFDTRILKIEFGSESWQIVLEIRET